MSVLIVGEKGYLGSYLSQNIAAKDLSQESQDYVINCAGLVSVELSENDPQRSYESNVGVILKIIREHPDSKIINFSSYYVYDEPGILCNEMSKTTDRYVYMRHKLLGERYTMEAGGVCFRLGKLYGHFDFNKQNRLTECIIKSKGDMVLDNTVFNPTSLETVCSVVKHELRHHNLYGLFNVSDDGTTTHYEYGVFILNALGIKVSPGRMEKTEKMFHNFGNFAMDISKIKRKLTIEHWTERMNQYLQGLNYAG